MSAAAFVLVINIFVASLFTAAFGAVAWRNRTAVGARWLALAYGLGIANGVLEFVLPMQAEPYLMNLLVFSVALGAFLVCVVGLASHYGVPTPWRALGALGLGSLLGNAIAQAQPATDDFLRAWVYQLPYFAAHMVAAVVVFRARQRGALDVLLLVFLLLSATQFIAKPFLVVSLNYTGPASYLQSLYGAYSQLLTAFLLIANGVLMLLIFVRDVMAEITMRSETDQLSALLNRRGFEDRARRALYTAERSGQPVALVIADLDHFKSINDSFGHDAGDRVIAAFAALLTAEANAGAVLGRHGGEEFAMLLPGADLAAARNFAETIRQAYETLPPETLGIAGALSASFGVTQMTPGDSLSDLVHYADNALYAAKKAGRNRVHAASMSAVTPRPDRRLSQR